MPDTLAGGAYQNASGAWFDAEGKPLDSAQRAEAKRLLAARADQLAADEQARMALEAKRNPTAQAIAAALAPKAPAKAEPKS